MNILYYSLMVFIINKNDIILTTCETIDNVYQNILTYIRIAIYCNKNKINYFDDLQIVEYQYGTPINSYYINTNTLDIYDENDVLIPIKSNTIKRTKMELELLLKKDVESEIKLFLPVDINTESSYHLEDDIYIKQKSKQELNNEIELLKKKIEKEKKTLDEQNSKFDKTMDKYLELKHNISLVEIEKKNKKEKEEEKLRIFKADNEIYNKLYDEIYDKNIRSETDIPIMFISKFKIFQKINQDYNDLSDTEKYKKYNELKSEYNTMDIENSFSNIFSGEDIYGKLKDNLSDNETDDDTEQDESPYKYIYSNENENKNDNDCVNGSEENE